MGQFVQCVHVVLSGRGGELSRDTVLTVSDDEENQYAITRAVVKLAANSILQPGDTISIEEGETEI